MSHRFLAAPAVLLALTGMSTAMAAAPAPAASPAASPAAPANTAARPATRHAGAAKSLAPQSDDDKAMYSLGVILSGNLQNFELTEAEFALVRSGFNDGFHQRADVAQAQSFTPKLQALIRARVAATAQRERQVGKAYEDKLAANPAAHKTASGLIYIATTEGSGAVPTRTDRVKVNYEGKLIDGSVFDSSAQHGAAASFPVGQVIPCWTEALMLMKVGGKAHVVCPADLAYGDRGAPPKIKPGSTLDFTVELLEITPSGPPPSGIGPPVPPPSDPNAPAPANSGK